MSRVLRSAKKLAKHQPLLDPVGPSVRFAKAVAQNHDANSILSSLETHPGILSNQVLGLHRIAVILNKNRQAASIFGRKALLDLFGLVKTHLNSATPAEVKKLAFFARVMQSFDRKVLDHDQFLRLARRITELEAKGLLTLHDAVSLSYDLAVIGKDVRSLVNLIQEGTADESVSLHPIQLTLVLKTSAKLNWPFDLVKNPLQKLSDIPDNALPLGVAIEMLESLLELAVQNEEPQYDPPIQRLSNQLRNKIGWLSVPELRQIFYLCGKHPSFTKDLFSDACDSLTHQLTHSLFEMTPIKWLQLVSALQIAHSRQEIPHSLLNALIPLLTKAVHLLNSRELSQLLLRLSSICPQLDPEFDQAVKTRLQTIREMQVGAYIAAVKGVTQTTTSLRPTDFHLDKQTLLTFVDKATSPRLAETLNQLLSIKNYSELPELCELENTLVTALITVVTESISEARKYAIWVRKAQGAPQKIQEIGRTASQTLINKSQELHSHINLITHSLPFDEWKAIMENPGLSSKRQASLLQNPWLGLKQRNFLLNSQAPSISSLAQAMAGITGGESITDLRNFISHLSKVNLTFANSQFALAFNAFSQVLHTRDLAHFLGPVAVAVNQWFQQLRGDQLRTPPRLKMAATLAMIDQLESDVADRYTRDWPFHAQSADTLWIATKTSDSVRLELGSLEIPIWSSFQEMTEWLSAYLSWPESESDSEVQAAVIKKCDGLTQYHTQSVTNFLQNLRTQADSIHQPLVEGIILHLSQVVPGLIDSWEIAQNVKFLEIASHVSRDELAPIYNRSLEKLGGISSQLTIDQKASILASLTRRGIRQAALIQQLIRELMKATPHYNMVALSALTELGLHDEVWATDCIQSILSNTQITTLSQVALTQWLWNLLMVNADSEIVAEAIEAKNKAGKLVSFKDLLITNHFRLYPPPVEYRQALSEEESDQAVNCHLNFGIRKAQLETMAGAFVKQGIEARVSVPVKGVWAPIYTPHEATVFWPLTTAVQTYDREGLRGPFSMHKNHLEQVSEKVVLVEEASLHSFFQQ